MGRLLANFAAISVGAGNRTGLMLKPLTMPSHNTSREIPNRAGTMNPAMREPFMADRRVFTHHDASQKATDPTTQLIAASPSV